MLKEMIFKIKVKKLTELNIRQHLERQGFEVVYINTDYGRDLIKKLKIENYDKEGFTYNCGKLKYVFLNIHKSVDDEIMNMLHEAGHVTYDHKTNSKHNEAEAWKFAYNVKHIYTQVLKLLLMAFFTALITFALTHQTKIPRLLTPQIQQESHSYSDASEETSSPAASIVASDEEAVSVYVTRTGTKYHRADCHYISGKDVTSYTIPEAQKHYTPCKVCKP